MRKIQKFIPDTDIQNIISDYQIKIIYTEETKRKGYLKNNTIYISNKFPENRNEILRHELFHFFEEKHNIYTFKIISETAARIFTKKMI